MILKITSEHVIFKQKKILNYDKLVIQLLFIYSTKSTQNSLYFEINNWKNKDCLAL